MANTSQHLQELLLGAGLVRSRRVRTRIFYSLASDQVGTLWRVMRDVAAVHVRELDELARTYLGDRTQLAYMDREELLGRLNSGDVVVLDVRPRPEFDAGHVPGAINVPPEELQRRLSDLPRGKQVVAYCRGPYCVYADDAVRALTARGVTAHRLVDGLPEWAAAGLPVVAAGG